MNEEVAPAKINLFLHVGPVRADGLHAIESLFVFAEDGDRIRVAPARDLTLTVEGPFAAELSRLPAQENLVLRAAKALSLAHGVAAGAALTLDKRLPLASGIGGGSADAAATLRALIRHWGVETCEQALVSLAFSLGADVPACLAGAPIYVSGAGERQACGPVLPPLWIALANPLVAMPTGPIFKAFDRVNPRPASPDPARRTRILSYGELTAYLARTRNDLEPLAVAREPVIRRIAEALMRQPGGLISRMSGSGATVFALYSSAGAAERAAGAARGMGCWSIASRIRGGVRAAS